jgi:hypothetical protein
MPPGRTTLKKFFKVRILAMLEEVVRNDEVLRRIVELLERLTIGDDAHRNQIEIFHLGVLGAKVVRAHAVHILHPRRRWDPEWMIECTDLYVVTSDVLRRQERLWLEVRKQVENATKDTSWAR